MKALLRGLAAHLREPVRSASAVSGGDINDAFKVELASGRHVLVKTRSGAPDGFYTAEAFGLGWLAESEAIRIPKVLAVYDAPAGPPPHFLALEFIPSSSPSPEFDEQLGRALARVHQAHPHGFGLESHNFIGSLPQSNTPHDTWAEFYRRERLEPQFRQARARGCFSTQVGAQFERLLGRLEERVGPAEPPARLHGDLWGGNLHRDESGAPCLLDPAVYGGHREMDLAMMRLFGGFGPRVFAAYHEAYPLAPGHTERVALCQLYPLLVHVNLFGGVYAERVAQTLRELT